MCDSTRLSSRYTSAASSSPPTRSWITNEVMSHWPRDAFSGDHSLGSSDVSRLQLSRIARSSSASVNTGQRYRLARTAAGEPLRSAVERERVSLDLELDQRTVLGSLQVQPCDRLIDALRVSLGSPYRSPARDHEDRV